MNQNLINHVGFVVDRSGSMSHLTNSTISVFDTQIKHLAKRSEELDQETRATVYLFDTKVECLFYDKDVMRLPSLLNHYRAGGGTGLIDATILAIKELKQTAQLHGDHSFLLYVLTDGEETQRMSSGSELKALIDGLPVNWTVAVLVPDDRGINNAKTYGFPPDNTMKWDTTVEGMKAAGEKIKAVTESYMIGRTQGVRGTKSLFHTVDTSNLASRKISDNLDALHDDKYVLADVTADAPVKAFVEKQIGTYVVGNTYYQLTKTEEVQDYKKVAVQNKISKNVYVGDKARALLGLPATMVKLKPDDGTSKFNIFIQSTSINRKLIAGTKVLILK